MRKIMLIFFIPTFLLNSTIEAHTNYSVKNLFLSGEDRVLRGITPEFSINFWVPDTWEVKNGSFLKVVISHSTLLSPRKSSLTVSLNKRPIKSIFLTHDNSNYAEFILPISEKMVMKGKRNSITFEFLMRPRNTTFNVIEDPSCWSVIHKESFLHLKYISRPLHNISFPNLDIPNTSDFVFIIPDKPNNDEIKTVMYLSVIFKELQPDKSFEFTISKLSEINREDMLTKNIVLIGNLYRLPLRNVFKDILPSDNSADSDTIIKAQSPWNIENRIFIVTGSLKNFIKRAKSYILNKMLDKKKTDEIKFIDDKKKKFTFKDLGFSDQVVRGFGIQSFSFKFEKPIHWIIEENSYLRLFISHSQLLKDKNSTMTVYLNDIPLKTVELKSQSSLYRSVKIKIPYSQVDSPTFNFRIVFHFGASKDFEKGLEFKSRIWATVHQESYLYMPHYNMIKRVLKLYPFIFSCRSDKKEIAFILPDRPSSFDILVATRLFIYLVDISSHFYKKINICQGASFSDSKILNADLIVIGEAMNNSFITTNFKSFKRFSIGKNLNERLPLKFSKSSRDILPNCKQISYFKRASDWCSLAEIIPSPWDLGKTAFLVSIRDEKKEMIDFLTNTQMLAKIDGDVILMDSEGKFNPFNTIPLKKFKPKRWREVHWFLAGGFFFVAWKLFSLLGTRRRKDEGF